MMIFRTKSQTILWQQSRLVEERRQKRFTLSTGQTKNPFNNFDISQTIVKVISTVPSDTTLSGLARQTIRNHNLVDWLSVS